jgi:cytochrome c5
LEAIDPDLNGSSGRAQFFCLFFNIRKGIQMDTAIKNNFLLFLGFFLILFFANSYAQSENNKKSPDSYYSAIFQGNSPPYPRVQYGTGPHADIVKRGEYLVIVGDCISCHSKPGGSAFSGGLPMETPFGTLYTPNITPDKSTGIGNWSTSQFIKAMHEGISPTGQYYYPAFPYAYFRLVTKQDLIAIKAYLEAIPPVNAKNQEPKMKFPFSWRFLQLGWRLFFFQDRSYFKPDPNKSPQWNRGKYLVEGLGHCGMCHTPMHYVFSKKWVLGAPIKKYNLTGSFVQGFYAPNITKQNLKHVTAEDLVDVFLKERLIGGGYIQGPMAEAEHYSLTHLTKEDLLAIATFLKSVKSKEQTIPQSGPPMKIGKIVFKKHCIVCHTRDVAEAPQLGDEARWATIVHKKGLNQLYANVVNGIGDMPPRGTCLECNLQQLEAAVQYLVSNSLPGAGHILGTERAQLKVQNNIPEKPLSLQEGKKIYEQHCDRCHNGSYPGAPKLGDKAAWAGLIDQGIPKLLNNTINGHKKMPARGACYQCTQAQLLEALIYMVEISKTKGNYLFWLGKNAAPVSFAAYQRVMSKEELLTKGFVVYKSFCAECHGKNGQGSPPEFPALAGSSVTIGPASETIQIVLNGIPGTNMKPFRQQLTAEQLAAVITFIRNAWDNQNQAKFGKYAGGAIQPTQIMQVLRK